MRKGEFKKKTAIEVPVSDLFTWHAREGAIFRLTPPWSQIKLVSRSGMGIDKGVQVRFRIKLFGIPMTWEAEHVDFRENVLFRDQQTRGPFAKWDHSHLFHRTDSSSSVMEDQVKFKLPLGILSAPFYGHAIKELGRVFAYRHRVLKYDLEKRVGKGQAMRILVSGASGAIGSALVPFLRTCGHEVIRLVRDREDSSLDTLFWDPYKGELDMEKAGPIDAVINLNGVDISRGKWTENQKKLIMDSRVVTTALLVDKMKAMDRMPKVFISASAIGLYGEGGDLSLTEESPKGNSFISQVCDRWEEASIGAQDVGIRTIQLRIGVVLTPAGGALERMKLPFSLGLGTRLSHGNQYMSWISMDDTLGGILHLLDNQNIQGPVNLTAPNPVTNKVFTKTLGKVFCRPAFFVMPRWVARLLWGEMGQETLLTSARVVPGKLLKNGFEFEHSDLESALKDVLGR